MTSRDEEEWFRKFYEGTFLMKGWKHRVKEIFQKVPDDEKAAIGELLENLGRKIGREWAKDNRVRRIDSDMLQKWGNDLRAAGIQGANELIAKIREIDSTSDDILA